MYMPYTTNPHLPKVRMKAVRLVRAGWPIRQASRYIGVQPSTVLRWVRKAPADGRRTIPTLSSRPHHHPRELSVETVQATLTYRAKYQRCAEVIHYLLLKDNIQVSLSSVKRTLKRHGLTYPSPWKKWHQYPPRPIPEKPGILVEIDTMWDGLVKERLSVYACIDLCSRWAYALPVDKVNAVQSVRFVGQALNQAPFSVKMIQSDHGSEFAKWFTKQLLIKGIDHRHSRVRKPSDNGHIERFIRRTLQEECLNRIPRNFRAWQKVIPEYIHYYDNERPHMALNMQTPIEVLRSY